MVMQEIKTKVTTLLWWIYQIKSTSNEGVSTHLFLFTPLQFLILTELRLPIGYQLGHGCFFLQCKLDMHLIYFFQVAWMAKLIICITISKTSTIYSGWSVVSLTNIWFCLLILVGLFHNGFVLSIFYSLCVLKTKTWSTIFTINCFKHKCVL